MCVVAIAVELRASFLWIGNWWVDMRGASPPMSCMRRPAHLSGPVVVSPVGPLHPELIGRAGVRR
jgi:hypothetical protein